MPPHTSFSGGQWTIDAYSLSLAALLLPMGSLADIPGRRRVFAAGLALFTLGSLLCGIAGPVRKSSRSARCRASAGPPLSPPRWRCPPRPSRAAGSGQLSVSGVPSSPSLGCAPVLGGLLSEVSWRLIFIINIPAGLAAIVLTLIGVQEFRPPGTRRIDLPGSGVFTLGLVALIYGLAESGSDGWSSDRMIAE